MCGTRRIRRIGDSLLLRSQEVGEGGPNSAGRAFNLMAEDLSKLYQDMEQRVLEKTGELTRSNQSPELLYHSIARLHGAPPGREAYMAVLRDIEELLGLGHGIVCLGEHGGSGGRAVASTMQPGDANPCAKAECLWCHASEQTRISITENFHRHLTLPLPDAERQYGVLILEIPEGKQLDAWQVQLLEALSRHIGVAIGAERRIEQNRRVALLEERAVITRELHDSLAQRHAGEDHAILEARHALYQAARAANPARWSGQTRNWSPVGPVTLDPERDSVVSTARDSVESMRLAA